MLEAGIAVRRASPAALQPNRPEGHFWTAANMGALAESFGLRQGLKYRGDIRDELLTVLQLDPAFQQGIRRPRARPVVFQSAGTLRRQQEEIRRAPAPSLGYNPNSIASHFFLAETLIDMDRKDEASAELQRIATCRSTRSGSPKTANSNRRRSGCWRRSGSEV